MTGQQRGKLKVFLGFAAGVGKTYQMLEEAQQMRRDGADVVIAYFEPHGRKDTIALTSGLETVPRRTQEYRSTLLEEMDLDAILRRHPQVCLVDEFPHTNAPGSNNDKRWKDVLELLDAGVDVLTTVNVQHLESLNDQVFQIPGIRVRETIPDWVMENAAEVVMVDLTPRALLNRLERGVVYSPENAKQALTNFFRESTLVALREMALLQTAHEVGIRHCDIDGQHPALTNLVPSQPARRSGERILVVVTAEPASVALIRRAKRVADFTSSECVAIALVSPSDRRADVHDTIEKHLNFARNLHVETHTVEGESRPQALGQFARTNGITQIYLNWPQRVPLLPPFFRNEIQKIVSLTKGSADHNRR